MCEVWRDYEYIRETGEFVRWIGDEYIAHCEWITGPVPDPPIDDDGYDGGIGYGISGSDYIKSECDKCKKQQKVAETRAASRLSDCRASGERWARGLCGAGLWRGRSGTHTVPATIPKEPEEWITVCDTEWIEESRGPGRGNDHGVTCPRGTAIRQRVRVRVPNPVFEDCVDEWTDGFDATTVDSGGWSGGAEIDLDPITIDIEYGGERQTTTVGPTEGYTQMCDRMNGADFANAQAAFAQCAANVERKANALGQDGFICRSTTTTPREMVDGAATAGGFVPLTSAVEAGHLGVIVRRRLSTLL